MSYDKNNIFAKILRGEIPCNKVYEDEHVLAFKDIRPQAKVHALVIPKGAYVSAQDFGEKASDAEIGAFNRAVSKVARELGVAETGYRLIANTGATFDGNRDALVSGLNNSTLSRAAVLRQIVENGGVTRAKTNQMFVMMEYFGYLRRDPDEGGYQFWLNKLNEFNGNFEQAEMVKAFITSGEYRGRFPR